MLLKISCITDILSVYQEHLGKDFTAYTNHCLRVANFCLALNPNHPEPEKIYIAAAFHDLGIWTANTFDYLAPSQQLASNYLESISKAHWSEEILSAIENHHKITAYTERPEWITESFRKADWIDVSKGIKKFGLSLSLIRQIKKEIPNAGFHKKLVQLSFKRIKTHSLSPLPMIRW